MVNFVMAGRALFSMVAALCILNIALAGNTNAPKITDILANEDVGEALGSAWKESFSQNPNSYEVKGGWIYADSNYPDAHKYLLVQHASKDRSPQDADADIELDNPEKDVVLSSEHYKLVADFHTHPSSSKTQQRANSDDIKRAYERGVPGIVVSCSGVHTMALSTGHRWTDPPATLRLHPKLTMAKRMSDSAITNISSKANATHKSTPTTRYYYYTVPSHSEHLYHRPLMCMLHLYEFPL